MTHYSTPPRPDELYHYGIKGMRWGVRRYENEDGTLTEAGKNRYGTKENYEKKRAKRKKITKAAGITAAAIAASLYGKGKYNEAKYKKRSEAIDNYHKRLDKWQSRSADAYRNLLYKNNDLARRGEITNKELLRRAYKRDAQYERISNKIFDARKLSPDQIVKIMKKAKRKNK